MASTVAAGARTRSLEPRRNLRPRLVARCAWSRIEAHQRAREFLESYRWARTCMLAGVRAEFPPGTYWLRPVAAIPIAA